MRYEDWKIIRSPYDYPRQYKDVLLSLKHKENNELCLCIGYYDPEFQTFRRQSTKPLSDCFEVLAWMELPEAYG